MSELATVAEPAVNGQKPEITVEQIAAYQQKRLQEVGERIQQILDTYRCTLTAIPRLTADGRVVADVQLKAL